MEISVKTTNLTKSKLLQMDYISIPKRSDAEVLGWVNMNRRKYTLIKIGKNYYRTETIKKIEKELKGTQFHDKNGGWHLAPRLHQIMVTIQVTSNGGP